MRKLGSAYVRKAARSDAKIADSLASLKRKASTCATEMDFRTFIKLVMPNFQFYTWTEKLIDCLEEVVDGTLIYVESSLTGLSTIDCHRPLSPVVSEINNRGWRF